MMQTARFRREKMARAAEGGFTNATDAADYLVKKGMPFREAHEVVGKLVLHCLKDGKASTTCPLPSSRSSRPCLRRTCTRRFPSSPASRGATCPAAPRPKRWKPPLPRLKQGWNGYRL